MCKLTQVQFFKILAVYIFLAVVVFFAYRVKYFLTPARKRPFQCSDKSLAQPFVEDTITTSQLYFLGIYFPVGLIVVCELIAAWKIEKSIKNFSSILKRFIIKTLIIVTLFLMGLAVERLYKSVAKIKMARLRPHFISVCQPINSAGYKCFSVMQPDVMYDYQCSSISHPDWAIKSTFASFPSGHTSLTSYGMMFLICYLYLLWLKFKHTKTFSFLLVLIVQAICFFTILFVAISRVLDFKHHCSDVAAGFVGGSCIALAINYYLHSQWENIEQWLRDIMVGAGEQDIQTIETGCINKNFTEKEGEVCTLDVVDE